jgi:hypothetical protein
MFDRTHDAEADPSDSDLKMVIWGVDSQGERFLQAVKAREVSLRGALLSGLDTNVRAGDVIGILYEGRMARFRVVWIASKNAGRPTQAAVHRLEADACPWSELLPETASPPSANGASASGSSH